MHSKSDNIEVTTYDNPDEIIGKLFDSLFSRFQVGLETQIKRNDFIFDCVNLLYYICYKLNVKRGGSYIDSPD